MAALTGIFYIRALYSIPVMEQYQIAYLGNTCTSNFKSVHDLCHVLYFNVTISYSFNQRDCLYIVGNSLLLIAKNKTILFNQTTNIDPKRII